MSDKSATEFLQDQLEALLASPALARVSRGDGQLREEPATSAGPAQDGDTQPCIEIQALRDAPEKGLDVK